MLVPAGQCLATASALLDAAAPDGGTWKMQYTQALDAALLLVRAMTPPPPLSLEGRHRHPMGVCACPGATSGH